MVRRKVSRSRNEHAIHRLQSGGSASDLGTTLRATPRPHSILRTYLHMAAARTFVCPRSYPRKELGVEELESEVEGQTRDRVVDVATVCTESSQTTSKSWTPTLSNRVGPRSCRQTMMEYTSVEHIPRDRPRLPDDLGMRPSGAAA